MIMSIPLMYIWEDALREAFFIRDTTLTLKTSYQALETQYSITSKHSNHI